MGRYAIGDKVVDVVTGKVVMFIEIYDGHASPFYRRARVRFGDVYKIIRLRRLRLPMPGELRAYA